MKLHIMTVGWFRSSFQYGYSLFMLGVRTVLLIIIIEAILLKKGGQSTVILMRSPLPKLNVKGIVKIILTSPAGRPGDGMSFIGVS